MNTSGGERPVERLESFLRNMFFTLSLRKMFQRVNSLATFICKQVQFVVILMTTPLSFRKESASM
jgi:hypothetical protein